MKNKSDMPTHVIEDWERAIERFQKSADPIIKRNQEKIKKERKKIYDTCI